MEARANSAMATITGCLWSPKDLVLEGKTNQSLRAPCAGGMTVDGVMSVEEPSR